MQETTRQSLYCLFRVLHLAAGARSTFKFFLPRNTKPLPVSCTESQSTIPTFLATATSKMQNESSTKRNGRTQTLSPAENIKYRSEIGSRMYTTQTRSKERKSVYELQTVDASKKLERSALLACISTDDDIRQILLLITDQSSRKMEKQRIDIEPYKEKDIPTKLQTSQVPCCCRCERPTKENSSSEKNRNFFEKIPGEERPQEISCS